jgi:hypothetical protein
LSSSSRRSSVIAAVDRAKSKGAAHPQVNHEGTRCLPVVSRNDRLTRER